MRRIRWNGPRVVRRIVGPYVWGPETDYVQDVADEGLALELLTAPNDHFVEIDIEAKPDTDSDGGAGRKARKRRRLLEESV